jgi:hypothetical protein
MDVTKPYEFMGLGAISGQPFKPPHGHKSVAILAQLHNMAPKRKSTPHKLGSRTRANGYEKASGWGNKKKACQRWPRLA